MSKCKDCNGRGTWTQKEEQFGEVELMSYFCGTCNGTGKIQNDDNNDDFDVAGVGVTEGDSKDD